ncbi:MAG TPA: MBL fold metallo-hydrolase [Chromatiaceae bacterium]|nr:MBL fold metallo-hydrolase [Chromatiaceae bacterium]
MKKSFYFWFPVALLIFSVTPAYADHANRLAVDKVKGDFSVMVLGSGGPVATSSGRASAGYLIFIDAKPRILMDVGGGTFQRLAKSGVNVKDLELVLLSHLHIDHTGDLSSVVKTIYFHNRGAGAFRTAPIHFIGPAANNILFPPVLPDAASTAQYPDTTKYIDQHFDLNEGIERYLHIFSRAISGGVFNFTSEDVPPDLNAPMKILFEKDGLVVKSIAVTHGPVPALAFRIEYKGKSIVYSGDTSSKTDNMIALAQDADLLIYDTAIMDDLPNGPNDAVFFALHTTPTRLGEVAAAAQPRKLLLSHITPVTEPRIKTVKQIIRQQGYFRKIKVARDLKVINLLKKKY